MKFLCSKCGACCKLAGPMGGAKHGLPINKDGSCANLVNNECSIYKTRPNICRVDKMVYNKDNMSKKDYFINATKSCHKLIDINNLDSRYKIDIKEYNNV